MAHAGLVDLTNPQQAKQFMDGMMPGWETQLSGPSTSSARVEQTARKDDIEGSSGEDPESENDPSRENGSYGEDSDEDNALAQCHVADDSDSDSDYRDEDYVHGDDEEEEDEDILSGLDLSNLPRIHSPPPRSNNREQASSDPEVQKIATLHAAPASQTANPSEGSRGTAKNREEEIRHKTPMVHVFPTVQNVVATVKTMFNIDLHKLAAATRNSEYNPKRFGGVVIRIREPRATGLIFRSGTIIVTGAKSENDARLTARKLVRILQKTVQPSAVLGEFKIHNVVGSLTLTDANGQACRLHLEWIQCLSGHSVFCSYEPELFAGLIYRMLKPKVTFLIFATGKVVLTGAKTSEDMHAAWEKMFPLLIQNAKRRVRTVAGKTN